MVDKCGYVYVIKVGENYKIGKTRNYKVRFGEYSLLFEEPHVILLAHFIDMNETEKQLHCMFAHCRRRGEWFLLSECDLTIIKNYFEKNCLSYVDCDGHKEIEDLAGLDIKDGLFTENIKMVDTKGRFLKVMDKEKELLEALKKYPSTYMAVHIMAKYLWQNNLLIKDGKKFKQKDLAEEMGITRQMATIHISRLKELNVIAEVPTNRGNYWAMNPDYFCRSEEVPKVVYDAFHGKITI